MLLAHLTPVESPVLWCALLGGFVLGFVTCAVLSRRGILVRAGVVRKAVTSPDKAFRN